MKEMSGDQLTAMSPFLFPLPLPIQPIIKNLVLFSYFLTGNC